MVQGMKSMVQIIGINYMVQMTNFMVGSENELHGSDEKLYGYRN